MANTRIRAKTQIMDQTLDLGRLELDFLNGAVWNITNGNNNGAIRGSRTNHEFDDELITKYYVDQLIQGLDWKDSAQFTTLTDISAVYTSTGGTGGTGAFTDVDLTSTGLFDFGSHVVEVGDRVLIKDQTDETQNGIYVVTSTGAAGGLERADDHDGAPGAEVSAANAIFVENGDTYEKTGWVLQGDGILTLNTDDLHWVQFAGAGTYTAGDGLDLAGNQFSVDVTDIIDTAKGLTEDSNNIQINAGDALDFDGGTGALDVQVDDSTIEVNGSNQLQVKADGINDTHIDWGLGANQVNAGDVPTSTGNFDGILSGADDTIQKALDTLDDHNHSGTYAENAFTTIATDQGTNPVADSTTDTLTLKSSSGVIVVTGDAATDSVDFDVAADGIDETHIDWGSGADQVDATSIPLDSGGTYGGVATNVQDALEELEGAQAKWSTIVVPNGTNPEADTASDTLTFQSSSGVIVITGYDDPEIVDFDVADDGIKDYHIDWGTGADQVSAVDMPVDASGFTKELGAGDTDVQTALATLDQHDHDDEYSPLGHTHSYAPVAFDTIVPTTGESAVADSTGDTLTLQSSSGVIVVTGLANDTLDFDVADDSIGDNHINWGTGAGQVSAVDVPIADAGDYFTGTEVETALQELAAATPGIGYTEVWNETPTLNVGADTATLANSPVAGTVRVFLNGLRVLETSDYAIVGNVITFVSPGLQPNDTVYVDYSY